MANTSLETEVMTFNLAVREQQQTKQPLTNTGELTIVPEVIVQEPIVLNYSNEKIKAKRRWFNPLRYPGAIAGFGYSLIWPATIVFYLSGGSSFYNKYFPHEGFLDSIMKYGFRIPSDFVGDGIQHILRGTNLDIPLIVLPLYLTTFVISGHILYKTPKLTKNVVKRIKRGI